MRATKKIKRTRVMLRPARDIAFTLCLCLCGAASASFRLCLCLCMGAWLQLWRTPRTSAINISIQTDGPHTPYCVGGWMREGFFSLPASPSP